MSGIGPDFQCEIYRCLRTLREGGIKKKKREGLSTKSHGSAFAEYSLKPRHIVKCGYRAMLGYVTQNTAGSIDCAVFAA